MSEINREGLQIIAETLGRARERIVSKIGDTSKNPGALLALETIFCRLRTATLFHDEDSAEGLLLFGEKDPVGLGIQGGEIDVKLNFASDFPEIPSGEFWSPYYYGPPSPEGWGVWKYNAWSGWIPRDDDGNPIYTTNGGEPSGGSQRLTKNHPVRWDGTDYEEVPFYESATWVSFYNPGITTYDHTYQIEFFIPNDAVDGHKHSNHLNDAPLDVRFYSHIGLVQEKSGSDWQELDAEPSLYEELSVLAYTIQKTTNGYNVTLRTVNDPSFTWGPDSWWHIAMYWGSQDDLPTYTYTSGTTINPDLDDIIFWPRKNFFNTRIYESLSWKPTSINDDNKYLVASNRTHFLFKDGEYSNPEIPPKYELLEDFPKVPVIGLSNSMIGYSAPRDAEAVPVIICATPQGTPSDGPIAEYLIISSPPVPSELWPANWDICKYFPRVPRDYVLISRLVLAKAPGSISNLVAGTSSSGSGTIMRADLETGSERNILAGLSIIWADQEIKTFAQKPHGDPLLASIILPEVYNLLQTFRNLDIKGATRSAAFDVLLPASRFPETITPKQNQLLDSASLQSKIFRGLLKNPFDTDLQNPDNAPPRAIPFNSPGIAIIEDLSAAPPSTEMGRLNSNALSLTKQKINIANNFEIYMEPSSQCEAIDPNKSGIALGQDYTIRFELEDSDENVLQKDLFVMASMFFLTDGEYANRELKGQSTTGYYRRGTSEDQANRAPGTLETIDSWRLHGYAGIIPDLTMGDSRLIRTKVVSPPDETRETEEQFRKRLANQGYTEDEIDEEVQDFLNDGGEFLIIDLNQYPELWVGLRNLGVSVSKYTFSDVPYWKINLNPYFGIANAVKDDPNPSVEEVRADSFTIAPTGLSAGDLEQYGTQSVEVLDPSLNQTSGGSTGNFSKYIAFKIETTEKTFASSFSLRLQVDLDSGFTELLNSSSSKLIPHIYANNNDLPGQRIISGDGVSFGELSTSGFTEITFSLPYTFSNNNTYWIVLEKTSLEIGGTIEFDYVTSVNENISKPDVDNNWINEAGEVWIKFYQTSNEVYGAFNRDTPNITAYLPPPNKERESNPVYKVEGHWAYTCKDINPPSQLSIYPRAFHDGTQWRYAKFSNDIHVCVKYSVDGIIKTLLHTFNSSPSWRAQWWKKSSLDYNNLDTSISPTTDEIITSINYTNFTLDGQNENINTRIEGVFTPIYNESYTLSVTSSQGVRVYINDVLVLDEWLNDSLNTFNYVMGLLSNTTPQRIVVEHFHSTGSQRLQIRWQSSSQTLAEIGPSTSVDPTPAPLIIDSDKIQRITYLSVGKEMPDITTPTNGAPPGDKIVIRSV